MQFFLEHHRDAQNRKSHMGGEPGKQRGKPVRVQFTFPVSFILQ